MLYVPRKKFRMGYWIEPEGRGGVVWKLGNEKGAWIIVQWLPV